MEILKRILKPKVKLFPTVFIGCDYTPRSVFEKIESALDPIPFTPIFASHNIDTETILTNVHKLISASDFCLFELSKMNPNVCMELGVAYGLKREFYIVKRSGRQIGDLANLRGIKYLEYKTYKIATGNKINQDSLWYVVSKAICAEHDQLKELWDLLSSHGSQIKVDKLRYFAFAVLAFLRVNTSISEKNLIDIVPGLGLRMDDKKRIFKLLEDLKFLEQRGPFGSTISLLNSFQYNQDELLSINTIITQQGS